MLECEKCKSRNYRTSKNKANTGTRLELKKFCRACNALTTHKETR